MKALVVYESVWGNTAAVAHAVAEGIGEGAVALHTDEATPGAVAGADLVVAGAPILGFMLPTEPMLRSIGKDPKHAAHPPDTSHTSMRSWLAGLEKSTAACAAFETKIGWSPGSSAKKILKLLGKSGCRQVAEPESFVVTGTYGPLADGELDRAREWGARLAKAVGG